MKEKAQKVVSVISGKFKATSTFRKSALIFLFTVLLTATFFFSLDVEQQKAEAEINAVGTVIGEQYAKDYGTFKGASGKTYYYLDAVTQDEIDSVDDGWFESIWKGALEKIQVIENVGKQINMYLNSIVNALFKMNIFFTVAMITAFDLGTNFNIIDGMIDSIDGSIFKITGVTNGGDMTGGGLFGAFINVIIALTGGYAIYMLVISRRVISGVKAIFQVIACLAISLILLSNFGYYMKGMNSITTDLSNSVITSVTPATAHNSNDPTGVKNTLWSMFVERPYLYMQYGQGQVGGELTKSRIETLLGYDPMNGDVDDEDSRKYYVVKNEVGKHSNTLMTEHSVMDKLSFSIVYLAVNGLVSIPIYAMALFMVLLQFWFIVMAGLAPFALLVGCIPSMSNVLKRYAIEVILPLGLKIGFSFISIFVMLMATYVFEYSNKNLLGSSNILLSYISVMFMFIILFFTVFILRNRIMNMFTKGNAMLNGLREGAGQLTSPITNTVKSTVKGGAMVAGAAIGGLATGGAGAMTGANIGANIGGALTGEKGVGDAIGSTVRGVQRHKLMAGKAENGYERGLPTSMSNEDFTKQMEAIQQIEDKEQRQVEMDKLMSKNGIAHDQYIEDERNENNLVPLYASTSNVEQEPSRHYEQLEHDRVEKEKIAQQIDGEDNVVTTYNIEQLQQEEDSDNQNGSQVVEERDVDVDVYSTNDGTIVTATENEEEVKDQQLHSLNTDGTTAQTPQGEEVQISQGASETSEHVDIKVPNETNERNYDEDSNTFKGAKLDDIDNPNTSSVSTSSQEPQVDTSKVEQAKAEAEADLRNAQKTEQQAQEEHVKAQEALAQAQANAQQNANDANAQQVLADAEKAEAEAQMHLMHSQQERHNAEQKAKELQNIQNPTLEGANTPTSETAHVSGTNVETNHISAQQEQERKQLQAELLEDDEYQATQKKQQEQMREAQSSEYEAMQKQPTSTSMGGGNATSATTSLESPELQGNNLEGNSVEGSKVEAVSLEEQSQVQSQPLQSSELNSAGNNSNIDNSLEGQTLENSAIEAKELDGTQLKATNNDATTVQNQPLPSAPLKGNDLNSGGSVEGSQLKATPLKTPNDGTSATQGQSLQSTPLKGNDLDNRGSVEGSQLKATPLKTPNDGLGNGGSVEGSQLKATPLKTPNDGASSIQSQSLQSTPLKGSDLGNGGSIEGNQTNSHSLNEETQKQPSTNNKEATQEHLSTQNNSNFNKQGTGQNSNTVNLTALDSNNEQNSDE